MVQGEDIACARARRREIASWMWEMMSVCLAVDGRWQRWAGEKGLVTMKL